MSNVNIMKRSILGGLAFLLASTSVQAQEVTQFPEVQAFYDKIRYTDNFKKCVDDPVNNLGDCFFKLDSNIQVIAMKTQKGPFLYLFESAYNKPLTDPTKEETGYRVYGFNSSNGTQGIWPNQMFAYKRITKAEGGDFLEHLTLRKRMGDFRSQITSGGAKGELGNGIDNYLNIRPYLVWWGEEIRKFIQKQS